MLSKRVNLIHPSPTLKVTATARRMRAEGRPVISFAAGEPRGDIIRGSEDFSLKLLENHYVATIPGIAFRNDIFIRLSFATSEKDIIEGTDRLKEFINQIK